MRTSRLRAVTILPLVALVLAACTSSTSGGQRLTGGTATFAELPSSKPNYIFPLTSGGYFSVANLSQFQFLMFRPLYWFGQDGKVTLNSSLSLAIDPQYSNGGKTVTMKLKGWKWSDGTAITSRDIEFWMNLLKANLGSWAAYSPKEFPDNVIGMSYPDDQTAVFTLDKAYGSYFFTYNELSQITPLPQHAWDKTSDSSPIGDYDRDPKKAVQVYKYLDGQSKSIGTYNTNPLWQVVSGPWKLKSMTTDGRVAFVPNPGYSGPVKPTLAEFDELPFTTDTAEFNVVHAGGVDYGYIPYQDADQRSSLTNYTFTPWIGWSITYFPENFGSPKSGAIFKQLYFRQAMQRLIDQPTIVKNIFKGYATPDYGPVPIAPPSLYADAFEQNNPYPYDPAAAAKLLTDNGWTVKPGGVSTCTNPGTGAGQCGEGVKAGARASFSLQYASGFVTYDQEMQVMKTAFSKAGIEINLSTAPFDTVISTAFGGNPNWEMANWGGGWIFAPDYYPTGDEIFSTGAGSNAGLYSNATNDANTVASTESNDVNSLYTYEDFLAKDLPVVWIPVSNAQLSMVKKTLHGWDPQDPILQLNPENWYFTAS